MMLRPARIRTRQQRPNAPSASMLLTNQAVNSSVAESYRMLRTSLLLTDDGERPGTILITSAGRDEGKSLTCANLGIVLASTDQRVAIVDADLRLPTMHRLFGILPGDYPALLQDPTRAAATSDPDHVRALAVGVLDNLWIVPAGAEARHPSELLASERCADMFAALAACFDVVLIDSPPVGLVTDAAVLAPQSDGVLFVVNYTARNRRQAQRALRTLQHVDADVLGIVVNAYPEGRRDTYGAPYGAPIAASR